uniref:Uncharacterized protein n=1 Tax=Aegilops tauschii subsp. strangulata TaxID=200361 RepID=A0A453SQK5_AEGTS
MGMDQGAEEALRFLADNCGLAVDWLSDIVDYLGKRSLADPRFVADLAGALSKLKGVPAAGLDAGLLTAALDVLEAEFCRLLAEHSAPLAMQEDHDKAK